MSTAIAAATKVKSKKKTRKKRSSRKKKTTRKKSISLSKYYELGYEDGYEDGFNDGADYGSAYEDDYGFFMDGGHESWAWSKERLDANLKRIGSLLAEQGSNFYLIQEVDIGSTRSYRFDERTYLTAALNGLTYTWAQNYDSPFLFYPFYQPHGASKSCLMTFCSQLRRKTQTRPSSQPAKTSVG